MKIIDCSESEFLKAIEKNDRTIIGFGTGKSAQLALGNEIIRKRLDFFIDNDSSKHDRHFDADGAAYMIYDPEIIKKTPLENKVVLICSTHFSKIAAQLDKYPVLNETQCYIYPVIRLNFANKEELFEKRVLRPCLQEYSQVLLNSGLSPKEHAKKIEIKRKYILGDDKGKRPLVLPRIMIMPTTRCNLKCKDCSSLFPYFENPKDADIGQLIDDLEIFFSEVDECIRITIGGEPFLYRHLERLLSYLIEQTKLSGILMYTNSTITPRENILSLLTSNKVEIMISDYGFIDKMGRLVSLFEDTGINFTILSDQRWIDMGNTAFRGKDDKTRRLEFLNCEQPLLMKAICDGKMFTCARSARMYSQGAYKSSSDYFDLRGTSTKERIDELLFKEIADACNHCDCGKLPTKMIPAGIQLNEPKKPHSAYTLIKREELETLKKNALSL